MFFAALNLRAEDCDRVISLSPSISDVLKSLDLFTRTVGISSFDSEQGKVKIGGLFDPNLEAMVKLSPTVVFGLREHEDTLKKLQSLSIKTQSVDHRSVEGVMKSILTIGQLCKKVSESTKVYEEVSKHLEDTKAKQKGLPHKSVIIVVGRNYDADELKDVYLSGKDGFYDSLLEYAGGDNAFTLSQGSVRAVTLEGIFTLNPDIIIEVLPPGFSQKISHKQLITPWRGLSLLKAVRENKIFFLDEEWATVPGPHMIKLLDRLVEIVSS